MVYGSCGWVSETCDEEMRREVLARYRWPLLIWLFFQPFILSISFMGFIFLLFFFFCLSSSRLRRLLFIPWLLTARLASTLRLFCGNFARRNTYLPSEQMDASRDLLGHDPTYIARCGT